MRMESPEHPAPPEAPPTDEPAPGDARETFESGQQSEIEIRIDVADPVRAAYASLIANEFGEGTCRW